jgi:hypothetical protein
MKDVGATVDELDRRLVQATTWWCKQRRRDLYELVRDALDAQLMSAAAEASREWRAYRLVSSCIRNRRSELLRRSRIDVRETLAAFRRARAAREALEELSS